MTIKKRLAISNIIMIVVPVIITLIIGCVCIGAVYFTLYHTNGFGFEDSEDFYRLSQSISVAVDEALEGGKDDVTDRLDVISKTLNYENTALIVSENGETIYSFGTRMQEDDALVASIQGIGGNGFISTASRQVYRHISVHDGAAYEVYLFSAPTQVNYNTLKAAIAVCAAVIFVGIICSIVITNRFLIKFVFRRIEDPLDELAAGVKEISSGNLEYRINYEKNDEFTPICNAFNDMAVRLKRSVELTRNNEESRKKLLLNISHDLRSPLTSVKAYVEGLLDGVASDTGMRRRYLETIRRKTTEIDNMVSKIFEYSKLDSLTSSVDTEKTDILKETQDIADAVSDEYNQKGLLISVSGNAAYTAINTELYCRIVTNLLNNSLKYKNRNIAEMKISVEKMDGFVRVKFADNGPGVDEEELPKIFEVFYRADAARNKPGDGSGIGLAFVKSAVENMGGSVKAYNNEGLTVEIIFPEVDDNE